MVPYDRVHHVTFYSVFSAAALKSDELTITNKALDGDTTHICSRDFLSLSSHPWLESPKDRLFNGEFGHFSIIGFQKKATQLEGGYLFIFLN